MFLEASLSWTPLRHQLSLPYSFGHQGAPPLPSTAAVKPEEGGRGPSAGASTSAGAKPAKLKFRPNAAPIRRRQAPKEETAQVSETTKENGAPPSRHSSADCARVLSSEAPSS